MDNSFNASGYGLPLQSPRLEVNALQSMTPEQLQQLQQINQLQIQQLTEQMKYMQILSNNNNVTSSQYYQPPTSPIVSPNMAPSVYGSQVRLAAPSMPLVPTSQPQFLPMGDFTNVTMNGGVPISPDINPALYNSLAYPNTSSGINGQIHQPPPMSAHGQINSTATARNYSSPVRNVQTPNSLPLQYSNNGPSTVSSHSGSSYSSSSASTPHDSPATPKKSQSKLADVRDGPMLMGRPRQQVSSPLDVNPPSQRSSASSYSSVASSPMSAGPLSPESPRGPSERPVAIQNKPLHMQTRYPQDKCYSCMKKVYPVEKLGPVKDVCYHKGCFRCKVCHTQLTLKNFFHNQSDTFDLAVYCKSHQPLVNEKGPKLDAESFEIKSALNAPKSKSIITEADRAEMHRYKYDVNAKEIDHARKVPVANLQSGNKLKTNAWTKSKRDKDLYPTEVVRYDEPVPEYDQESYVKHQVETSPDY